MVIKSGKNIDICFIKLFNESVLIHTKNITVHAPKSNRGISLYMSL